MNNPLGCLWVMVLQSRIAPKQLVCKSDSQGNTNGATLINSTSGNNYNYGTTSTGTLSYAIAYPWNWTVVGPAPYWKNNTDSSMPLAADIVTSVDANNVSYSTGNSNGQPANSSNHNKDGQEVGYGDAHVEWRTSPNNVAPLQFDSIYHYGGYSRRFLLGLADHRQDADCKLDQHADRQLRHLYDSAT